MSAPLNFYLVTDLHHYAHSLGITGKAYDTLNNREQKCLAQTGAIIDSAFDSIIADKDTDIVLVAGDETYYGALECHLDLIPRLQRLKDNGKQVYLITATHDYSTAPQRCDGDSFGVATPTKRDTLRELYYDFGWSSAYSEHLESMSYAVKLSDGYRLLCLNDDGDGQFCGYSQSQLQWIKDRIAEAKKDNQYIFIMTHHPCLPPFALYPLFSKKEMLGDWENTTTLLADEGIEVVFTGHTHMQNIAVKTTEKGNKIYDVNTASLVGFPSCYRKVRIDESFIDVKTKTVDDFKWDRQGKSVNDYMKDHFSCFLNDILDSAAYDIDHLAELGSGFSMTPEQIYKLRVPLRFIGKGLQKWTLGKVGKIFRVSKSIDPCVSDILFKDFFITLIQNIYYGDEPYTPDTPEYKAMAAILDKAKKLLSHFKKTRNTADFLEAVKQSLYDAPPEDWNYVIDRRK